MVFYITDFKINFKEKTMSSVQVDSTRNFLQVFPITFEYPVFSDEKGDVELLRITGVSGAPEYVDPVEFFQEMKKLLAEAKAEKKAAKLRKPDEM